MTLPTLITNSTVYSSASPNTNAISNNITVGASVECLVVKLVFERGATAREITGVTFGGTPLAQGRRTPSGSTSATAEDAEIWTLLNPSASTAALVVNYTGSDDYDFLILQEQWEGVLSIGGNGGEGKLGSDIPPAPRASINSVEADSVITSVTVVNERSTGLSSSPNRGSIIANVQVPSSGTTVGYRAGSYYENITVAGNVTDIFWGIPSPNSSRHSAVASLELRSVAGPPPGIPNAPSGLNVTGVTSSGISFAWTDNATDETGQTIEIYSDAALTTLVDTAAKAANATTHTFTGLSASTQYWARVRASNGAGNSTWSNTATGTTNPPGGATVLLADDADADCYDTVNSTLTGAATTTPVFRMHLADRGESFARAVSGKARLFVPAGTTLTFELALATKQTQGAPRDNNNATGVPWTHVWRDITSVIDRHSWQKVTGYTYSGGTQIASGTVPSAGVDRIIEVALKPTLRASEIISIFDSLAAGTHAIEPPSCIAAQALDPSLADFRHAKLVTGTSKNSAPSAVTFQYPAVRVGTGPRYATFFVGHHACENGGSAFNFEVFMQRVINGVGGRYAAFRSRWQLDAYAVNLSGVYGGAERWSCESNGSRDTNRAWDDTNSPQVQAMKAAWNTDRAGRQLVFLIDWHGLQDASVVTQCKYFYTNNEYTAERELYARMFARLGTGVAEDVQALGAPPHETTSSHGQMVVGGGVTPASMTLEHADASPGYPVAETQFGAFCDALIDVMNEMADEGYFLVPAVPTGLSVTVTGQTTATANWTDESSNETGFELQVSLSSTFTSPTTLNPAANAVSQSITGLTAGTLYYARIRSVGVDGASEWSNVATFTTNSPAGAPNPPSGLGATAVSTSQINTAWTDNSADEDDFQLQYDTSPAFPAPVSLTNSANQVTRSVTGLAAATTYYFRVRARNASGNSAWSATASATTQSLPVPNAPSGLTAITVSASRIDTAWADNSADETSFELQYATDPGFSGPSTLSLAANDVAESVNGLAGGTTYYFRVRAVGAGGASPWSNTATATTLTVAPPPPDPSIPIEPPFLVIPTTFLSLSATSELTGFPARLLGRHNLLSQWRAAGSPIAIDVHVTGEIDTIALLGTNANEAATWVIQAGPTLASAQGSSPAFTTGSLPFRASSGLGPRPGYHGLVRLATALTHPYWRIIISHGAPQFMASILVMGKARVSTKNYSREATEEAQDLGAFDIQRDGSVNPIDGVRLRNVDFEISLLSETDIEAKFADLWWQGVLSNCVLAVPNSKAGSYLHDRILFGPAQRVRRTHQHSRHHTLALEIQSMI